MHKIDSVPETTLTEIPVTDTPFTSPTDDAVASVDSSNRQVPLVGVVMGSDSDWNVMSDAVQILRDFGVPCEVDVVSAHRTPQKMIDYGTSARERGLKVIIAGAGGAAHLPGMLAAVTTLPVVGVPVPLGRLDGLDSLLSIVQMPAGVPVATVSIGGARNAGLIAIKVLATSDDSLRIKLDDYMVSLAAQVEQKSRDLQAKI
ncbi:5-(carboxyamino)imidazole ribonucleotide mutase [Glaciibacter psychrotolerans]